MAGQIDRPINYLSIRQYILYSRLEIYMLALTYAIGSGMPVLPAPLLNNNNSNNLTTTATTNRQTPVQVINTWPGRNKVGETAIM